MTLGEALPHQSEYKELQLEEYMFFRTHAGRIRRVCMQRAFFDEELAVFVAALIWPGWACGVLQGRWAWIRRAAHLWLRMCERYMRAIEWGVGVFPQRILIKADISVTDIVILYSSGSMLVVGRMRSFLVRSSEIHTM